MPATSRDLDGARERLGIGAEETCVLVFGGSLGARTINRAAVDAFTGSAFRVLHIAGSREYGELSAHALPAGYETAKAQVEMLVFNKAFEAHSDAIGVDQVVLVTPAQA